MAITQNQICQGICKNGKQCYRRTKRDATMCLTHSKMANPNSHLGDGMICGECDDECPVCYCEVSKPIVCPNGHRCCSQHYLQDLRGMWNKRQDNHIKCFICRERIESTQFTTDFMCSLSLHYLQARFIDKSSKELIVFSETFLIDMLKILNHLE